MAQIFKIEASESFIVVDFCFNQKESIKKHNTVYI